MSDINNKILELIKEKKGIKEIADIINLSEKQVYVRIKQIINSGYQLKITHLDSSDIFFDTCVNDNDMSTIFIKIPKKANNFRCIVVSDLHIGNIASDINLMNYVYEYATKNNINYILNCGDVIEGDYTTDKKSITNFEEQVKFLINKYPYDRNIKNLLIFGNHDRNSLISKGFDVSKKINNSRVDMISLGYGQGNVNIRNSSFLLFHKLNASFDINLKGNQRVILSGHGHMMKTKFKDDILRLCVPTLSNVSLDKTKSVLPSFIELNVDFDKGFFDYVEAKQFVVTPLIIQVSETRGKIKTLSK